MGDLSTAGTTASTVIFRQDNIFVANVGDSTIVLGEYRTPPLFRYHRNNNHGCYAVVCVGKLIVECVL